MKEKNLASSKLAKQTGISEATLSTILNNKNTNPSFNFLVRIAKALDVKLSDILILDEGDEK